MPGGPLMIIGGAEDKLRKRTILKEFVAASGGADARTETINLTGLRDEQLLQLSKDNVYALNLPEMQAIRDYFDQGSVREQRLGRTARGCGARPPDEHLVMSAARDRQRERRGRGLSAATLQRLGALREITVHCRERTGECDAGVMAPDDQIVCRARCCSVRRCSR